MAQSATDIETLISRVTNDARRELQRLRELIAHNPEFVLDRQFKRGMATAALYNLTEAIAALPCAREDEIIPRKRKSEPVDISLSPLPSPPRKYARLRRASSGQ